MELLNRKTIAVQTAERLREAIRGGSWTGKIPGILRLSNDMGVAKATMRDAMKLVEEAGLVELNEDGRSRRITDRARGARKFLRIGILLFEDLAKENTQVATLIIQCRHTLEKEGFRCFVAKKTISDFQGDLKRLRSHIASAKADAWLVTAGPQEVLAWFAAQPVPAIALFGRSTNLPIASVGPDKASAYAEATRRLLGLGHKNITTLCRKPRRRPTPGKPESAFLEELRAHGIEPEARHLPDWEETPEGFHKLLDHLFSTNPPSALIIDEPPLLPPTLQFLAARKLKVPDDVSIVAADEDPTFAMCHPPLARIRWDAAPVVNRVVKWAQATRMGRKDLKQVVFPAKFVPGGTIAPPTAR